MITYRDTLSRNLTPAEVDANFRELVQQIQALTGGVDVSTLGLGYFNIMAYGAKPSNSAADNTAAIQAAVAAASAKDRGGVVYIPAAGDFLHNGNITYTGKVGFKGAGRMMSCLKSATAQPCFSTPSVDLYDFAATLSGLRLDGNNIGTIGIRSGRHAHFLWEDLFIADFTQKGIDLNGTLIGELRYVTIENCNVGVDAYAFGGEDCNLISFNYCTWRLNKTWAGRVSDFAQWNFHNNEVSGNGTPNNLNTGCFQCLRASPLREGVGFTFSGFTWFEQNWGIYIDLQEPLNNTTHNLTGVIFQLGNPIHGTGDGLRVIGRNKSNTVMITSCSLKEESTTYDVHAIGAKANIIRCPNTVFGTQRADEGALIAPLSLGSASGVATPPPIAAGSSYHFTGANQLLSAQNPDTLGFLPGQPGTIAMRISIDGSGGEFSISRGTDTIRGWDIDFAKNGDGNVRFTTTLFDSGGNSLSAFAGNTSSQQSPQALQPGVGYVAVVRYNGGSAADSLDILIENSTLYNNGSGSVTGNFSQVSQPGTLRIGRIVGQPSAGSYVDCLEFIGKRLSDAEAAEYYSNPESTKSYEANVSARYRFMGNLIDDKNAHGLTAPVPLYV